MSSDAEINQPFCIGVSELGFQGFRWNRSYLVITNKTTKLNTILNWLGKIDNVVNSNTDVTDTQLQRDGSVTDIIGNRMNDKVHNNVRDDPVQTSIFLNQSTRYTGQVSFRK